MRNPNRLDNFYEELKRVHKEYFPDWRFFQLVVNIQAFCGSDCYYVEENKALEILYRFCGEIKDDNSEV